MPEIQIRPVRPADIHLLVAIEHDYATEHAWQMELQETEEGQITVQFRPIRLPRAARVEYPRPPRQLADDWAQHPGLLVAEHQGEAIGYISIHSLLAPHTAWVTDLAILPRLRRRGIASALLLAAQEWSRSQGSRRLVLEMQPKNYPAICLAQKLGFDFCGYQDRYYANHDMAIFFGKTIR